MDSKSREKAITRTSITGIIANLFLVAFKAAAGLIAGSIAIILDAVNNLTDAMSSVITIAGIKLAKKKPDNGHPFGYGRIEYFSAMIISILVFSAGLTSGVESVKKIIHPEVAAYSAVTVVIVIASVITKLVLGKYVKKKGEEFNSDALVASGADASFDAVISISTLVGIIVTLVFKISIDGFIGIIISVFIIKAGIEMLLEAVGHVMGSRADSEITKEIKSTVASIDGVLGAYDLVLHNYGPDSAIGSVHIEIPADMTAGEIHRLTTEVQNAIIEKFHVFLTVGIYAVELNDEFVVEVRKSVREICTSFDGVINSHGVYVDKAKKLMSFDCMVDFTVSSRNELGEKIKAAISEKYPGYTAVIKFDTNYSD